MDTKNTLKKMAHTHSISSDDMNYNLAFEAFIEDFDEPEEILDFDLTDQSWSDFSRYRQPSYNDFIY